MINRIVCYSFILILVNGCAGHLSKSTANKSFTPSILSGQTLYDVWDNGHPDNYVGIPLKFIAGGKLTYGAERVLSTTNFLTSGTWAIDNDGILGIYAPTPYEGDSDHAYYKLINNSTTGRYDVCFSAKRSKAKACTKINEYLFLDLSTAQKVVRTDHL